MNTITFTFRSLRYNWRANVAVVVGVAVSACVLSGALAVGESLTASLTDRALSQLGRVSVAVTAAGRYFSSSASLGRDGAGCPAISLPANVTRGDGTARVNGAAVWAVGENRDAPCLLNGPSRVAQAFEPVSTQPGKAVPPGEAMVNEALAAQLGLKVGETISLQIRPPGPLPAEAPLALQEPPITAEVKVVGILAPADMGDLSLRYSPAGPRNVFVSLRWLQKLLKLEGRANVILAAGMAATRETRPTLAGVEDIPLELAPVAGGTLELRSERVFLDPAVAVAAAAADTHAVGILTYFANDMSCGGRHTPYSMVSAIGMLDARGDSNGLPDPLRSLKDDEILVSPWLADDLGLRGGETLDMKYFILAPGQSLAEASAAFRVVLGEPALWDASGAGVSPAPLGAPLSRIDGSLMPAFPGLTEANDCRKWRPGVPIDLTRLRDKDQEYWQRYRGTPKALVTLAAGRRLWGNAFGDLTAVRFAATAQRDELSRAIAARIDPRAIGISIDPVRANALAACRKGASFGGLFVGFSIFLVAAALLLAGLLAALSLQQRSAEIGALAAMGFSPRGLRRLMLPEAIIVSAAGALAGAAAGGLYARAVLAGLGTLWQGAVAGMAVTYHWSPVSLAGAAAAWLLAVAVGAAVLWSQTRRPVTALLAPGAQAPPAARQRRWGGIVSALCVVAGVVLAAGAAARAQKMPAAQQASVFFAAAALLLIGVMGQVSGMLAGGRRRGGGCRTTACTTAPTASAGGCDATATAGDAPCRSIGELGWSNARRSRGRSLAVAAMIACGSFLVVAVGANRHDGGADAMRRDSGTGGFAYLGRLSEPISRDLRDANVRRQMGIGGGAMEGMSLVPMRVHEGDDASCLNLARSARPRIMGVEPNDLAARGAFTFGGWGGGSKWPLLNEPLGGEVVPAIADSATAEWSLEMGVGDELAMSDERGRPLRLRLVAVAEGSILQGGLIISERNFVEHFPSSGGWRMLLVDLPAGPSGRAAARLAASAALQQAGLELTPAAARLAELDSVENAYLSIFAALGGLGMVLGCAGLGIVVLRNVLQRRGELAVLAAVGFTQRQLRWMVLCEHWGLLVVGLAAGAFCAVVAVLPALRSGAEGALLPVSAALAAMLASGAIWTYLAARWALAGPLIAALREE